MKKSVIAIGVGAFVVITTLLCMNPDGKMYKKQKHFDTVNDVLIQLETNKIQEIDRNGDENETSEFKECLSKRKRLTFSQMRFETMKIEKIEELDEEKKKSIIDDYNKAQSRLSMPYKPTKIEPIRLDVKVTYPYEDENGNAVTTNNMVDFVMVDEGEGMVIDYYVEYHSEKDKSHEENLNVKG